MTKKATRIDGFQAPNGFALVVLTCSPGSPVTRDSSDASSYHLCVQGARIAAARRAAGLTQRDLARRSGVTQPHIARIESGRVDPTAETVERLLRAARPDARAVLARHHDDIVAAVLAARGTGRVRVFGSVARGDDGPESDIDLLVDFDAGADLFDVVELEQRLATLLGRPVDVVPSSSTGRAARHAERDAVPLP